MKIDKNGEYAKAYYGSWQRQEPLQNNHFGSFADRCLTGLQISTNQRAIRKCIWKCIHSRAFREGKFTYSVNTANGGILHCF